MTLEELKNLVNHKKELKQLIDNNNSTITQFNIHHFYDSSTAYIHIEVKHVKEEENK